MNYQYQKINFRSILLLAMALIAFSGLSIVQAQFWDQNHKFLASDGTANDQFGSSTGLSGNLAMIGASGNNSNSGSAYVFDITTGQQVFNLFASDGGVDDSFGTSVAVSGDIAVIGAPGRFNNGSAYVFDVTTGQQLFKLLASDGAAQDKFGNSVAISGNLAVIGARYADDNGSASGSAYVFDITTGQQLSKLLAADGVAGGDQFGNSVAISGNLAVVGAPFDDDNGTDSGSVYVFDATNGEQLFKLHALDGSAGNAFGTSVSASSNLAVIGSSTSAYIFDLITGEQTIKLLPSDGAGGQIFVNSVSISGNFAVIGAENANGNVANTGAAYIFDV